jgi:uncharacterized damage-inducible protein DinB
MACDSLITALRSSPAAFRDVIQPAPLSALTWSDGGWSVAAVVMHVAIAELFYRRRFEQIVSEYEPNIAQIRSDELVPPAGNPISSPVEMLERWERVRSELCDWLARLTDSEWGRVGVHPVRGRVTLRSEIELIVAHDREHIEQASCMLRAWEERRQLRTAL